MPIKIIWEATCDFCGETTTVHSPGLVPIDPTQHYYGGEHTEYGWICEGPACRRQLKLYRIVARFTAAIRSKRYKK